MCQKTVHKIVQWRRGSTQKNFQGEKVPNLFREEQVQKIVKGGESAKLVQGGESAKKY